MSAPALNVKKPASGPALSGEASRKIVRGENPTPAAVGAQHSPDSHPSRILAALLAGESLTAADAWRRYSCARLAAVIRILRCEGWLIQSERVAVRCADGRTAYVARYSMGSAS